MLDSMELIGTMIWALIWIQGYFFLFFLVGTMIKNNSIVDMGWGIGFVLVNWLLAFQFGRFDPLNMLVGLLVSLWGIRLFAHILRRNLGKPEDFRYANWRKEWGRWVVPRAFLQVYVLQGIMMWLIGMTLYLMKSPVLAADMSRVSIGSPLVLSGLLIWMAGYYFEVVGDKQLEDFKKNASNKGKILDTGLWKYTRHPNYFGEATMWWGIWVIAMAAGAPAYSVISPLVITWLLRFVSGVPLLEKSFEKRPGFAEYKERTPIFIPWFPKK